MKFVRMVQVYTLLVMLSACVTGGDEDAPVAGQGGNAGGGGAGAPSLNPVMAGGDTTVFKTGADAFSLPGANLSIGERSDFATGNSFFRDPWVIAPSSTENRDGIGPIFNLNSCQGCHIRDGRGHAREAGATDADSMLVRLAVPPSSTQQAQIDQGLLANAAHEVYGGQIQDRSNPDVPAEAEVGIQWTTLPVTLSDGTVVELRKPTIQLTQLGYGPISDDTAKSGRIAPAMIGMGLLEAIPEAEITAREDVADSNGDGISGKANRVFDPILKTANTLGRFGWKALMPSVRAQTVGAFNGDMGLTSTPLPNDGCTESQTICRSKPHGGTPEVTDIVQDLVTFYSEHLAVPARRDIDSPRTKAGEALFQQAGCPACHVPHLRTSETFRDPKLAAQDIFPYTDLLLHDLGPGLADDVSEFRAAGSEWRTAPLWGIGLAPVVAGDQPTGYLHDGRARSLLEAILWHDGEAKKARDAVAAMTKPQRDDLIQFLESL